MEEKKSLHGDVLDALFHEVPDMVVIEGIKGDLAFLAETHEPHLLERAQTVRTASMTSPTDL